MKRGDIVQFVSDWGQEPTPGNTSIIKRVAKSGEWADVVTPYGSKRVTNFEKYLKVIKEPLVVYISEGVK